MLKPSSKQARENTRKYIMDHFDPSGYVDQPPEKWEDIARFIMDTFYDEKCRLDNRYQRGLINRYQLFFEWCQGLPSLLDTCYYYNRSAVDDLGSILEETEAEKARFTEAEAEARLTHIIYMELQRGCKL
jgi:hypothetical protein